MAESEGIFASALRLLSLSPVSAARSAIVVNSSGAETRNSVASSVASSSVEVVGGGGGSPSPLPTAAAIVVVDPVREALVRGSVRAAGLEWATLEACDGVLPSRLARCARVLEGPHRVIDADALRAVAWAGLPARYRTAAWQLLLGYLPLARDRAAEALARRKNEFAAAVAQTRGVGGAGGRSEAEQALLRQVLVDVPRTCPDVALFHCEWAQRSLERILFTYAARHFATGYVQGLNDLATPFYAAFLTPYLDPWKAKDVADSTADAAALADIEADVYWCLCRLLEGIQDHYTPSQPGIQRMIHRLRELVHRIDEPLVVHLESNGVDFSTFAFRWMNCLLMRELPLALVVRLWDTYFAESRAGAVRDGFHTFHVYVCAALLLRFSAALRALPTFGDLLPFLQRLPTTGWKVSDVEELIAQAFVHKSLFEDAKSHLAA